MRRVLGSVRSILESESGRYGQILLALLDQSVWSTYASFMNYRVVLIESEEGYSATCPALRGCHSQGNTVDQALQNIRSAIREWLEAEEIERSQLHVIEKEVSV